jgi:hypothetical protein
MLDKNRSHGQFPTPEWAPDRWKNIRRDLHLCRRANGCVARCRSATRSPTTVPSGSGNCCIPKTFVPTLGTFTGNQAVQQVKAGLKAIYLSGWQVAADANSARADVSGPEPLPGRQRSGGGASASIRALQRADQIQVMEQASGRRNRSARLFRANRCRRRSRVWRRAQCVRADEGDDRGRGGGGAFRGSARVGKEVRAPGRQGAGADGTVHPHAQRGAAGGRCDGRADADHGAHRCRSGAADHLGRR